MRGTIGTGGHLGGLLQFTPPDVTPEQENTVRRLVQSEDDAEQLLDMLGLQP